MRGDSRLTGVEGAETIAGEDTEEEREEGEGESGEGERTVGADRVFARDRP